MAKLSHSAARCLGILEGGKASAKKPKAPRGRARMGPTEDHRPLRLVSVSFEVAGKPVPKQSFRTADAGLSGYTRARVKAYADLVVQYASIAMMGCRPWECPLELEVLVQVAVPKGWSKARRAAALAGEIAPTQRPDYGNIGKNIDDAMEGIVYVDDAQIVKCTYEKAFAADHGVVIRVTPRLHQQRANPPKKSVNPV